MPDHIERRVKASSILQTAIAGILSLSMLAGCADGNGGHCVLSGFGDIPIITPAGTPIVRGSINKHPVAFLIDTGAQMSTLEDHYAEQLGLIPSGGSIMMHGIDGVTTAQAQMADELTLGAGHTRDTVFLTVPMNLRQPINGLPVVGLFGADFVLNYDLLIDLPDNTLNLFRTSGCSSPTPLWQGTIHKAPMHITDSPHSRLELDLLLNGKHVDAILDSGAHATLIPLGDAKRAGVTQTMLDQDQKIQLRGVANTPIPGWRHRFETLAIGDLVLHDVTLDIAADQDTALLGADFLHTHRIWAPLGGSTLYIQSKADIPADDAARIKAQAP